MPHNPDYIPSGPNIRDNEYYAKNNHVKLAKMDYNKTEFFGTVGGDPGFKLPLNYSWFIDMSPGNVAGFVIGSAQEVTGDLKPRIASDTGQEWTGVFVPSNDANPDTLRMIIKEAGGTTGGLPVVTQDGAVVDSLTLEFEGETGTLVWDQSNGRYETNSWTGIRALVRGLVGQSRPLIITAATVQTNTPPEYWLISDKAGSQTQAGYVTGTYGFFGPDRAIGDLTIDSFYSGDEHEFRIGVPGAVPIDGDVHILEAKLPDEYSTEPLYPSWSTASARYEDHTAIGISSYMQKIIGEIHPVYAEPVTNTPPNFWFWPELSGSNNQNGYLGGNYGWFGPTRGYDGSTITQFRSINADDIILGFAGGSQPSGTTVYTVRLERPDGTIIMGPEAFAWDSGSNRYVSTQITGGAALLASLAEEAIVVNVVGTATIGVDTITGPHETVPSGIKYFLRYNTDNMDLFYVGFDIDADPDPDVFINMDIFLEIPGVNALDRASVAAQAREEGWTG